MKITVLPRYRFAIAVAAVAIVAGVLFYASVPTPLRSRSGSSRPALPSAKTPAGVERTGSSTSGKKNAISEAQALPRGFERTQRIEREGYEMGVHDITAALQQLDGILDPGDQAAFLRGLFTAAAQLAPREALSRLKQLKDAAKREIAMHALATAWRGGVPPTTGSSRFQAGPGGDRFNLAGFATTSEARLGMTLLDGTVARAEIVLTWNDELVSDSRERAALAGAAARAFLATDPQRVVALAEAVSQHPERAIFQASFADAVSLGRPEEMWNDLQQLPTGDLRRTALRQILNEWAVRDAPEAAAAVEALPTGAERTYAIGALAESWATRDTSAALAWAAAMSGDDHAAAQNGISNAAPVGIGAALRDDNSGYAVVSELLPGGSAERSRQIPAGSYITGIVDASGNMIDTKGLALADLVRHVRGPRGSRVTLMIQPPGESESRRVQIPREQIIRKTAAK